MDPEMIEIPLVGGKSLFLDPNASQLDRSRLISQYADQIIAPPEPGTLLGAVGQGIKGIGRGALTSGAMIGRGIAELIPGDQGEDGMGEFIRGVGSDGILARDPRYEDSSIANIGEGIGSMLTFGAPALAAGVLTGGVGAAPLIAGLGMGAASGVGDQAMRMDEENDDRAARGEAPITDAERRAALGLGAAVGLTEGIPVGRIAGAAGRTFVSSAAKEVGKEVTERSMTGALGQMALDAARSGAEEATQEIGAGIAQGLVSRNIYDPDAPIIENIYREAEAGFGAGALLRLGTDALAGRYGRLRGQSRITEEQRARATAGLTQQIAAEADAMGMTPESILGAEFEVRELPDGNAALFTRDPDSGEWTQRSEGTLEEMRDKADYGRTIRDGAIIASEVIQTAKEQRQDASGRSVLFSHQTILPESREVPTSLMAYALSADENTVIGVDPRSPAAVRDARRGLDEQQQVDFADAVDALRQRRAELTEAEDARPTARANPNVKPGTLVPLASRSRAQKEDGTPRRKRKNDDTLTDARGESGAYTYVVKREKGEDTTAERGREWRVTRYGPRKWFISPEEDPGNFMLFTDKLEEAPGKIQQFERLMDVEADILADQRARRRDLAERKRAKQQKQIDALRQERTEALSEASAFLGKVAGDADMILEEGADLGKPATPEQAMLNEIAVMTQQGYRTVPLAKARETLTNDQYDRAMGYLAGARIEDRGNLNREIQQDDVYIPSGRKNAGKLRARRGESRALMRRIRDSFTSGTGLSADGLVEVKKVGSKVVAEFKRAGWAAKEWKDVAPWAAVTLDRPLSEVRNPDKLGAGEKAYLLSSAATVSHGNTADPLPVPDPRPRIRDESGATYTEQHITAVKNAVRTGSRGDGKGASLDSLKRELTEAGIRGLPRITEAQADQLIGNQIRGGQVKNVKGSLRWVSDSPVLGVDLSKGADGLAQGRIDDLAGRLARAQGLDEVTPGVRAIVEHVENAVRAAVVEQGGDIDRNPALRAALDEAMNRQIKTIEDVLIVERMMKDAFFGATKLAPALREDVEIRLARDANELQKFLRAADLNPNAVATYQPATMNSPARVVVNMAALNPEGDLTVQETFEAARPAVLHESVRFMFDNDYFTDSEKRSIRAAARSIGSRETGQNYEDIATAALAEVGVSPESAGFAEMLAEQELAMMVADDVQGLVGIEKQAPVMAKGAIRKAKKVLRGLAEIPQRDAIRDTARLISEVQSGDIGDRGPGLGILTMKNDPAATALSTTMPGAGIRSTRALNLQEDGGEGALPPTRSRKELSTEEATAVKAKAKAAFDQDLSDGLVPRVNPEASPEALQAYFDSRQLNYMGMSPDVRYRLRQSRPDDPRPFTDRYANPIEYKDVPLHPMDSILQSVKSYNFVEALGKRAEAESVWNDIRENFIDGRHGVEMLEKFYRKEMMKKNPAFMDIMADQEAAWIFRMADQLQNLAMSALGRGKLSYVQATPNENGETPASLDPTQGNFKVVNEGLKTVSGVEIPSFADLMLFVDQQHKGAQEKAHHYMIALRNIQLNKTANAIRKMEALEKGLRSDPLTPEEQRLVAGIEKDDYERVGQYAGGEDAVFEFEAPFPGRMTLAESKALAEEVASVPEYAWMLDVRSALRDWNNSILDMRRSAGLITEEQYAAWYDGDYVPFYRHHTTPYQYHSLLNLAKSGSKEQQARAKNRLRELTGSSEIIDVPMFEAYINAFEDAAQDALVNVGHARVAKMLSDLGLSMYGQDVGYGIQAIAPDVRTGKPPADAGRSTKGDPMHTFDFWVDGQQHRFIVNTDPSQGGFTDAPLLIRAMNVAGVDMIDGFLKILPKAAEVLRETVTRTPAFMAKNVFRDAGQTSVVSGAEGNPLKMLANGMKNFAASIPGSDQFERALDFGIAMEPSRDNINSRAKDIVERLERSKSKDYNPVVRLWDWLGDVSRKSDAAIRMEVFEKVFAATGNEAEAAKQAREIMNFGRRGANPHWRMFTASVPFFNARIQGLDVLLRGMWGDYSALPRDAQGRRLEAQNIRRNLAMRGALLTGMTMAYYALVNDEEWYKNLRDEVKGGNWVVPIGAGQAIKFPIPFEVGLLFKQVPETMARVFTEEGYTGGEATDDIRRALFGQTLSFSPVPQLFSPLMDVATNHNSFTKSEIVPPFMDEGLPPEERRLASTSQTAEFISAFVNSIPFTPETNPIAVEYLMSGYLGTVGAYTLAVTDALVSQHKPTRDLFNSVPLVDNVPEGLPSPSVRARYGIDELSRIPMLAELTTNIDSRGGGYLQDFYETREEVGKVVAAMNRARSEGREADFIAYRELATAMARPRSTIRQLDRYVQYTREVERRILADDSMSDSEKRERLEELRRERDEQLAVVPQLREMMPR